MPMLGCLSAITRYKIQFISLLDLPCMHKTLFSLASDLLFSYESFRKQMHKVKQ
ncbi:hypothetical protein HanPI659440_Chr15g0610101 [Helianthus annuus]|nr:hypothetical protein HanPI659440_Chr15g0610101 [Helianthus annuus]